MAGTDNKTRLDLIKGTIRTIPDFPKPGIQFRDVTTLLGNAAAFGAAVDELARFADTGAAITQVAGIEARGFILGGAVAQRLGLGFVPVRKRGKLPAACLSEEYELEYGTDCVEIHTDAVTADDRVLVIDDLLATGGTAAAAVRLLRRAGAKVTGAAFVIDLPDLGGRDKLAHQGVAVHALCSFSGH
ncbi:MAG TPA: adenine phosphoribosyltransferase [Kofleriaceae bacterium]|nr:adenine phosphoribosyltransferase [Kofleriaceae bacterium]